MGIVDEHYLNERDAAHLLLLKREHYPDLSDRVKIETDWNIIEAIDNGIYSHIDERVEQTLKDDTKRIMRANLW